MLSGLEEIVALRGFTWSLFPFGVAFLFAGSLYAQTRSVAFPQVTLGDRIACQTTIEEVYWRHRENGGTKVIQRKAEDPLLKWLALDEQQRRPHEYRCAVTTR
jgi:hypothetical protein